MSLVAVHGPYTMYTSGAGGPGTGNVVTNAGGTVTAVVTNGLQFTLAGAGNRAAVDYDWSWSPTNAGDSPASPKNDTQNFTLTFGVAGAKVITLTVGSSAGTTPPPGTYTFNVTAVSGPRSIEEESAAYDPGEHTVAEVLAYVEEHPDEAGAIYDLEVEGKARSTLVSQLEAYIPYDPGDYTVAEVTAYAEENPDQLEAIIAAEQAGKNRSTLLSHLEALRPA